MPPRHAASTAAAAVCSSTSRLRLPIEDAPKPSTVTGTPRRAVVRLGSAGASSESALIAESPSTSTSNPIDPWTRGSLPAATDSRLLEAVHDAGHPLARQPDVLGHR